MGEMYMHICPKCAWFKVQRMCKYCNVEMIRTETTIDDAMELRSKQEKELINHYIETIIKDSYDPKAREQREYREEHEEDSWAYEPLNSVTCPYCHGTNVRKISTASKAVHTAVFGIFSMGRNSKNYHCNSCGSDF